MHKMEFCPEMNGSIALDFKLIDLLSTRSSSKQ